MTAVDRPDNWHDGPQGGDPVSDPTSGLLAPWPPQHPPHRIAVAEWLEVVPGRPATDRARPIEES